jgi:antitoxin component YwqK of YwqJK toxin-antitoxin module
MSHKNWFILFFVFCFYSCNTPISQSDNNSNTIDTLFQQYVIAVKKDSIITSTPSKVSIQPIFSLIPDSLKSSNQINEVGQRIGEWINFYDSRWNPTVYSKASFYRKVQYKNGNPIGKVIDFYISGYKQWEGQLISEGETDILEGKCTWYDSTGVLEKINNYTNGILHGKETLYFKSGKIMTARNYSNGVLSGKYIVYFKNGEIYQKGQYKDGLKSGKWHYYDEEGDYKLTEFIQYRIGAICNDGSRSYSTGRGTCSHHGGVNYWLLEPEETIIGGSGKYSMIK